MPAKYRMHASAQRATATEENKRKYPIVGQIKDVDGVLWDVRDVRTTGHGFDLHFGTPANNRGSYRGGLPRLIATKALRNFWDANRTKGHGFLYDLPAGRSTLKRVRKRLGFNFLEDVSEFWMDRIEDLESLPSREFAAKYGVNANVASGRRLKLIGKQTREIGWWRSPKVRKVLLSGLTLREIGMKLDISISQAHRLRDRCKREWVSRSAPAKRPGNRMVRTSRR